MIELAKPALLQLCLRWSVLVLKSQTNFDFFSIWWLLTPVDCAHPTVLPLR